MVFLAEALSEAAAPATEEAGTVAVVHAFILDTAPLTPLAKIDEVLGECCHCIYGGEELGCEGYIMGFYKAFRYYKEIRGPISRYADLYQDTRILFIGNVIGIER